MSQTHRQSFLEACANTLAGFLIAMATVAWIWPLVGVRMSVGDNFVVTSIMTVVSIARAYALRRLFNRLHGRLAMSQTLTNRIAFVPPFERYSVRYLFKVDGDNGYRQLMATNNKADAVAAVKRWRRNDAVMDVWLFDLNTRSHIRVD